MSAPSTARRVAVFTMFLFTAVVSATAGASAMVPDPPASGPQGPAGRGPAASAGGGPDLTTLLLFALAIVAVVLVSAGVAMTLRRHRIQPPAAGQAIR